MMKSCATCKHLFRKCDGECDACDRAVQESTPQSLCDSSPCRGAFEAMLEQIRFGTAECKCMVCYDEDSGRYRHWEENEEITQLLADAGRDSSLCSE